MDNLLAFSISVFTGFFAIMNPISNLPIYITLLDGADDETKHRVKKRAIVTAFVIVCVFIVLGKIIFNLFGITLPAFKITGGILIFLVGFDMLQSKKSELKHLKTIKFDENIAISPLAIPILAGPGTIVTAMNFVSNKNLIYIVLVVLIFAIMCYLNYLAFSMSKIIVKRLGNNVISVVGKIMGLIIAIIGTSMVIQGLKLSFDFLK